MSKQSKQYESMRQTQVNTFSDGLNMDLHPLTTPNTILTDCVNGTMITYNDNEFVLQNERGNTKIVDAQLNPGFIPVGMKEHNGILYIVSHNPQTKESEIGTYPSPGNMESQKFYFERSFEVANNYNLKYIDFENTEISYYDNTMITQYDEYELEPSDNPLVVLEHYVLTEGKAHKLNLLENWRHSFESPGEGILGYKYRPFQIDSIDMSYEAFNNIINLKLKAISTDDYLFDKYFNYKFKYDISVNLISSDDVNTNIISITKDIDWNYIYQLENFNKIEIPFSTSEYEYDENNKSITYKEKIYDKIKINITPKVEKDNYTYTFDNLEKNIEISPSELFNHKTFFSKFKYHFNEKNNLEIEIEFDPKKYEINGDINCSFELTDLEESINTKSLNDKQNLVYNFDSTFTWTKKSISINDTPLNISQEYQCTPWNVDQKPKYYKYNINSDNSLTIQLLGDNLEFIDEQTTCTSTMIDASTGRSIGIISEVSANKNKIYLGTLSFDFKTYDDNNISDIANFIIITDDSMLSRYWDSGITRMDEILFEDWYTKKYNKDKKNYENTNYLNCNLSDWSSRKFVNQSKYNNQIDFNKINDDEYKQEFLLKFKTFYPTKNINELENEIPKIGKYYNANYIISNTCPTSCNIKINNRFVNSYYANIKLERSTSLIKSEENKEDIFIRKYLYTLLKDTTANSFNIGNYVAFHDSLVGGIDSYGIRINSKIYPTTTNFSIGENITSGATYEGWEVKNCGVPGARKNKTCYFVIRDDGENGYWTNKILNGNGIEYGSINISGNNVKYDGETNNLWMRWKNNESKLMLVGQKYNENAKNIYMYYLHHLYITENIGECVQFTYDKEELKHTTTEEVFSYSITPIHKELNSIKNIQSINNLIPMEQKDKISYDESNETDDIFFINIESFLKNLASNITKWDQTSETGLCNDFKEKQYSHSGEYVDIRSMEIPKWKYVDGKLIFIGDVQEKTIKLGCDYVLYVNTPYDSPKKTILAYEGQIIPEINWEDYKDYYSLKYYKCMEYGA